jgi:UDP-N-acetyl-D-mannosaminuronate dehydrogenase
MYSDDELSSLGFEVMHDASNIDLVIVQTNHVEFLELTPSSFPNAKLILDGRNFVGQAFAGSQQKYLSIGLPG